MKSIREGQSVRFTQTLTEDDINRFAEVSGDFSPNHVDEAFMRQSAYGKRIAHGALLVAYMSGASSLFIEKFDTNRRESTPISLGYDRIRFVKPVFIEDTITVSYTVTHIDAASNRIEAAIELKNQANELVAIATHIMKWIPNAS